jgi:hypothetical protein
MNVIAALKGFARETLPAPIVYRLQLLNSIRKARRETASQAMVERRRNPLPMPLIISLTSFVARFATLHLTLQSLLDQIVTPDGVILWIAEREIDMLPKRVTRLQAHGLTIRSCPDVRSYKKLVFAIPEFPDAAIVTADDDTFYPPTWLETLVSAFDAKDRAVICCRAHRLHLLADGRVAPYLSWEMDVQDEAATHPSVDLVPTGVGGVLYPPGSLAPTALDSRQFQRLCPTGDDLWFYWMARLAGWKHVRVAGPDRWIDWPTSRTDSLMQDNWAGANDSQIRNLETEYGNPLRFA